MKKLKISLMISSYLILLALIFLSYDSIIPSDNVPIFENKTSIIKKIDNKFQPKKDSVYEIIEKKEFSSKKSEKVLENQIKLEQNEKNNVVQKNMGDHEKKKFRLQIASFKEKKKSEEIASKLNNKTKLISQVLVFTVKEKTLPSNEIFYRVVSKNVYKNQIANNICKELISKNIQCILIKDY